MELHVMETEQVIKRLSICLPFVFLSIIWVKEQIDVEVAVPDMAKDGSWKNTLSCKNRS